MKQQHQTLKELQKQKEIKRQRNRESAQKSGLFRLLMMHTMTYNRFLVHFHWYLCGSFDH
jgi:hypothetical protein